MTAIYDLNRVIGLLATLLDEDRDALTAAEVAAHKRVAERSLLASRERMRPIADELARCLSGGNEKGAWWLLGGNWSREEWQGLALALAENLAAREERRAA